MFSKEFTAKGASVRLGDTDKAIQDAMVAITNGETWHAWRRAWRDAYKALTAEIRSLRARMRDGKIAAAERGAAQSRRYYARIAACNLMTVLGAAKARRAWMRAAVPAA